ncbi:MAG TPA: ABC transporter permease [Steroidobacteraceae bacterium]|nr:ABC transporter permease [Steroidobacteraceae bacterium]
MIKYYLALALRSMQRNIVLTVLMIAAIGVGIGASMTVFTVLRTMSGDPIPQKSSELFVPQIDNWLPAHLNESPNLVGGLLDQLSYRDAMALMRARQAKRQTAMYGVSFTATPTIAGAKPFIVRGLAAYADFFPMFDVPFRSGSAWTAADDAGRTNVVVISGKLADRLFPGGRAVGRTIDLDRRGYRIVGVLKPWDPQPHFYDVPGGAFSEAEDVFLPFSTAIDRQMPIYGDNNCDDLPAPGWYGHLNSECVWLQFWVELPTAAAVQRFRQFLYNYAADQRSIGRFRWAPRVNLQNLHQWLIGEKVVPDEMRVSTLVAFGFLLVCLVNSIGLMLAKFSSRAGELGVRRALGASKADIFIQCLIETAVIGAFGGIAGLALTVAGLGMERMILTESAARLAHLNVAMICTTFGLAVFATVCSGLYPTWRASRVQPAWQLKAQ